MEILSSDFSSRSLAFAKSKIVSSIISEKSVVIKIEKLFGTRSQSKRIKNISLSKGLKRSDFESEVAYRKRTRPVGCLVVGW